jgi:5-hydroxyisourate hydrolase
MAGRLTTHVLDLMLGCGAGGLEVELRRLQPKPEPLGVTTLDASGRAVLLEGEAFCAGVYELTFRVGAYHAGKGVAGGSPRFLDEAPIRFGVDDAGGHWHVPLLVSPYGYSTYRGG